MTGRLAGGEPRPPSDAVDLRELTAALRHGAPWIAGCVAAGLALAWGVNTFAGRSYEGKATLLLRSAPAGAVAALGGKDGGSAGGLASVLGMSSAFDTEKEILTSRSVIGAVVDSLGLQATVTEPAGTPLARVVSSASWPAEMEDAGRTYVFSRKGDGYAVDGPGAPETARPGVPFAVAGGRVTLAAGELPEAFTLRVVRREAAIDRVHRKLTVEGKGGDVAELAFEAQDPATAAAVPNALMGLYLARRKTTDRGVNQHRYEFLTHHTDSIAGALAQAEAALRAHQQRTGVLDAQLSARTEVEQSMELRSALEELRTDSRGLREILAEPTPSIDRLAGYPPLMRAPAFHSLTNQRVELGRRITELRERRTERDPDMAVLLQQSRDIEAEMTSFARSYLRGLDAQEAEVQRALGGYEGSLATLPAAAEEGNRLQREVKRLSETLVALQTQMVQTRLAAIAEGGDVRPVDRAVEPRRPSFPIPVLSYGVGMVGGLFFGIAAAVAAAFARPRVRQAWEAELASGTPAFQLTAGQPLLLGGVDRARTVMVVPVGEDANAWAVAERLASTSALQGRSTVLADVYSIPEGAAAALLGAGTAAKGGAIADPHALPDAATDGGYVMWRANGDRSAGAVRTALETLEGRFDRVVVALPSLDAPQTVALLSPERPVVLAGRVTSLTRPALRDAAGLLRRLGIATAGVVLEERRRAPRDA